MVNLGRKRARSSEPFGDIAVISQEVQELLSAMDVPSVILSPSEVPIYYSESAVRLGIVRDQRIFAENLLALIRVVRRTRKPHAGNIEIPKGPIGEGTRLLSVKVAPFGEQGLLLALFNDESESERVAAVRRDFVANISHELKTPIGALLLLAEAVLESAGDQTSVTKFATRMQIEAKRLTDLVQEIINLSRLQDVDPLLDALTVDIDEIVDQAISQVQIHADMRNIELLRGPLSFVSVVGDRAHLIMAIHNLLENAINYSPDNTTVSITTEASDGIISINIIDQGIGISDSEAERVFERFYRVDPARSRETGGTGLGLSIVKHVASNHGGEVTLWSQPGVGSTFSLRLPIEEEIIEPEGDK